MDRRREEPIADVWARVRSDVLGNPRRSSSAKDLARIAAIVERVVARISTTDAEVLAAFREAPTAEAAADRLCVSRATAYRRRARALAALEAETHETPDRESLPP